MARSEPYNETAIHAGRLMMHECAGNVEFAAGDVVARDVQATTSSAVSDRRGPSQCLRVLQRSSVICAEVKKRGVFGSPHE
jgi:hypothetical protein